MKQELDKYFHSAKKLENLNEPFEPLEFDNLLNSATTTKRNFKFRIAGGIIMILFTLLLIYLNFDSPLIENSEESQNQVAGSENVIKLNEDLQNETALEQAVRNDVAYNSIEEDDNPLKINPDRKEPREELIRGVTIGTSGKDIDFMLPATVQSDSTGEAIPGFLTLQLTKEELAELGIIYEDNQISYLIEHLHTLHPIPIRNNDSYRNDPDNKKVAEQEYPVNGDTILVKTLHKIDLNYSVDLNLMNKKSYFQRSYRELPRIDTINGKVRRNLRRVVLNSDNFNELINNTDSSSSNNKYPDYFEYLDLWEKRFLQGYKMEVIKYGGWQKSDFSKISPIVAAFKYSGTPHSYVYQPFNSAMRLYYLKGFDYSKLIPLEITFNDKSIEKLILWYYPSPEFINSLPERYRKILVSEISIINKLSNGEIDINSACEMSSEETFFDICRFKSGGLSIRGIYPNPTYDANVTLDFSLDEMRDIEINIYDLQGSFIGLISKPQRMERGNQSMKLNLGKLNTGIYIIGIKSNMNEFVSQRIVIN
ncbi:MAG: T9SS type A sorting domain-containing protein [Candidatus Kapabacteria bacterium]|nr:T9SS type A sorting domain-containing protein [Ignavibacteriota bacterium]MCW5883930.1 T9SS type A sorting domain-containing protein [Candidatus Kapabacteria bacterium]